MSRLRAARMLLSEAWKPIFGKKIGLSSSPEVGGPLDVLETDRKPRRASGGCKTGARSTGVRRARKGSGGPEEDDEPPNVRCGVAWAEGLGVT